jgi:hypothetical protein
MGEIMEMQNYQYEIIKKNLSETFKRDIFEFGVNTFQDLLNLLALNPKDCANASINLIRNGLNMSQNISNKIFGDKLIVFLFGLKDTTLEERIKFLDKYVSEKEYNFADRLLTILEQLDFIEKAFILSKLFTCFLNEKISKGEFFRLSHALNIVYLEDLKFLKESANQTVISDELMCFSLETAGLIVHESTWGDDPREYSVSTLGKKMIEYGLFELELIDSIFCKVRVK